jgi:glycosyltransferase involved in cell wall biosynthesis
LKLCEGIEHVHLDYDKVTTEFTQMLKRAIYKVVVALFGIFFLPFLFATSVLVRALSKKQIDKPRLVWGSTPIIINAYWSRAMRAAGYQSDTFTVGYYGTINKRADWDLLLPEKYPFFPMSLKPFFAFLESLFKYDVFFLCFDGFFMGSSPFWKCESLLFRIAGKKTVLIPYGADAFVYRRIRSTALLHGLLMSYPFAARNQGKIAARLDYWIKRATVVLPGMMGVEGFGRWDTIFASGVFIDANQWCVSSRKNIADGKNESVYVAHAPNHRGVKGTEFVIEAVDCLRKEGLKVELLLLERMQNTMVQEILEKKADILVEQLIITGHGLNGVEGMASGIPVVCNLEDETYILPFRRWSYFSECPLVSASPETLVEVLRKLITRPELRHQLGKAGREYVEKYHGLDSAQYLFREVIEFAYGRRESLINLYHPLLGEYPKRKPRVTHPLVNNHIVD